MLKPRGCWPLTVALMLAAQGSWAVSPWSLGLTLGPERFVIPSSQGGATVDQMPWAGRLSVHYTWRKNLSIRAGTGFLTGTRLETVTPARGVGSEIETRLWGYPAEIGLTCPMSLREKWSLSPGIGLGYYRLRYEEKARFGDATMTTPYRISGFGGVLSAGLEGRITDRLSLTGEVRSGLVQLRESWSEGSDSTRTAYSRDVRPVWSGMGMGFRWKL